MTNPIADLHALGQSIWYDNIERRLLENGEMAAMITRGDIRGVTSNPSIFNQAIAHSTDYDAALAPLARAGQTAGEIFESLAIADIQAAADLFRPLYEQTRGGDGYVSLEVDPHLAHDSAATAAEALRLWERVARPNLMVKIPATPEGIPAITESIARGINVNVTLIFSTARYLEVMEAYLAGLEKRLAAGRPLEHVASVASFFVSRIDSKTDKKLDAIIQSGGHGAELAAALRGRMAVANAKKAYQKFKEVFGSARFQALQARGARLQRPLWASTSTKDPAYPDVKYVAELIGADTVNTVPPQTLAAFGAHGEARLTLESGLEAAGQAFEELRALGIYFQDITQELEDEGVAAFSKAFDDLLAAIDSRMGTGTKTAPRRGRGEFRG